MKTKYFKVSMKDSLWKNFQTTKSRDVVIEEINSEDCFLNVTGLLSLDAINCIDGKIKNVSSLINEVREILKERW